MTKTHIAYAIILGCYMALCILGGLGNTKAAAVDFKEDAIGKGDFKSDTFEQGATNKAEAFSAGARYCCEPAIVHAIAEVRL
ncbi:MAG: hypothetical protein WB392_03675 [Methanotrichaceae archaeon]